MSRHDEVQKKYDEILRWVIEEEDKLLKRLQRDGKFIYGLDTHQKDFAPIYRERDRRIAELKKQYSDLFNK